MAHHKCDLEETLEAIQDYETLQRRTLTTGKFVPRGSAGPPVGEVPLRDLPAGSESTLCSSGEPSGTEGAAFTIFTFSIGDFAGSQTAARQEKGR